jgi:hypothetical protein
MRDTRRHGGEHKIFYFRFHQEESNLELVHYQLFIKRKEKHEERELRKSDLLY